MKVKFRSSQALLLGAVALVAVIAVTSVAAGAASDSDTRATAETATATQAPVGSLTEHEAAGILFMREEEKLANDA